MAERGHYLLNFIKCCHCCYTVLYLLWDNLLVIIMLIQIQINQTEQLLPQQLLARHLQKVQCCGAIIISSRLKTKEGHNSNSLHFSGSCFVLWISGWSVIFLSQTLLSEPYLMSYKHNHKPMSELSISLELDSTISCCYTIYTIPTKANI